MMTIYTYLYKQALIIYICSKMEENNHYSPEEVSIMIDRDPFFNDVWGGFIGEMGYDCLEVFSIYDAVLSTYQVLGEISMPLVIYPDTNLGFDKPQMEVLHDKLPELPKDKKAFMDVKTAGGLVDLLLTS